MLGKKPGIEYIVRAVSIIGTAVGFLSLRDNSGLAFFVICLLAYTLSSQIRMLFLRNPMFVVSVFLESAAAYYMNTRFGSLACLLYLIPLSDSLLALDSERWFIAAGIAVMLVLSLAGESVSVIIVISAIFIMTFFMCIQVKKLRDSIDGMETLYDENRNYSYQIESAKERLEEYSKKVEVLSQQEERNRISRELHDTVGHKLTGALMQLDAAIRVNRADTASGSEMLGSVRDNLSGCIDLLRETVRNMKPAGYGEKSLSIQRMAEDFGKRTGVNVSFKVTGNPFKLYPSVEITLFKNAQEALTNSARHGKASNIGIELEYAGREVILTVRDDGPGCENVVKGMGISGMEERVALLGGCLAVSSDNGFVVKTIIPVRE